MAACKPVQTAVPTNCEVQCITRHTACPTWCPDPGGGTEAFAAACKPVQTARPTNCDVQCITVHTACPTWCPDTGGTVAEAAFRPMGNLMPGGGNCFPIETANPTQCGGCRAIHTAVPTSCG